MRLWPFFYALLGAPGAVPPADRAVIPAGELRMGETRQEVRQASALCAQELSAAGALQVEVVPRCRPRVPDGDAATVYVPAFAMDRTEVTLGAYSACVAARRCRPLSPALARRARHAPRLPAEELTFDDAVAYCAFVGGRLPSEAEWERAARGPGRRLFPWGRFLPAPRARRAVANLGRQPDASSGTRPATLDELTDGVPDPGDGFAGSAPAGSFPAGASPYGVLDLAGNVWEWTSGLYSPQGPQAVDGHDPRGPQAGSERVVRGGSYLSPPSLARSTARAGLDPSARRRGVGARCAYDLSRAPEATLSPRP